MYAKIENDTVVTYPYTYEDLKSEYPDTSFPMSMPIERLNDYGMHIVVVKGQPEFDLTTQKVVEGTPIYNTTKGQWEQNWLVVALTPEEQQAVFSRIQQDIVDGTQKRLDDFARTRNYDGILSACTYATSTTPRFASEGQYCVTARDDTWLELYVILEQIQAGTRPIPHGYSDIEADLPALTWPV